MNTKILDTIWLWENLLDILKVFFLWATKYTWLWVWIYLTIIITLYALLNYSKQTFTKINTLFRVSIDTLYYETSLILYKNKNNIYEFKDNIPLLLQYKTGLINKKDKAYYYENFEKLIEEIEYIYNLTDSDKTLLNKDNIIKQHNILLKLIITISNIEKSLTIITLWLYKLL